MLAALTHPFAFGIRVGHPASLLFSANDMVCSDYLMRSAATLNTASNTETMKNLVTIFVSDQPTFSKW